MKGLVLGVVGAMVIFGITSCSRAQDHVSPATPTDPTSDTTLTAKQLAAKIEYQLDAYKFDVLAVYEQDEIAEVEQDLKDFDAGRDVTVQLKADWKSLLLRDMVLEHGRVI